MSIPGGGAELTLEDLAQEVVVSVANNKRRAGVQ
jgi:hypothetical protein